jgi:tryprostatin B 6-hydroxylase
VQPGEFIPERWYSKPELIKDATAWAPFVKGPYQCIGKPLAMMQIRTLAAKVISAYDMHLAPGEDGSSLLYDSKDHFSMTLAPLHLVFTRIEPTTT